VTNRAPARPRAGDGDAFRELTSVGLEPTTASLPWSIRCPAVSAEGAYLQRFRDFAEGRMARDADLVVTKWSLSAFGPTH
jgi:hypothetical protein